MRSKLRDWKALKCWKFVEKKVYLNWQVIKIKSSHQELFCKKVHLKNLAKSTPNRQCWSILFIKVSDCRLSLQVYGTPVNCYPFNIWNFRHWITLPKRFCLNSLLLDLFLMKPGILTESLGSISGVLSLTPQPINRCFLLMTFATMHIVEMLFAINLK